MKSDEQRKWKDVTIAMMSDEEEIDGKFKVSHPEWPSFAVAQFCSKK